VIVTKQPHIRRTSSSFCHTFIDKPTVL